MQTKKILIIDEMHSSIIPLLKELDVEVLYEPHLKRDEILPKLKHVFGVIVRSKTLIDKEFLNYAQNIRFIARAGAGIDLIDMETIAKRNILVINAPEGNRDAVAEHTLGLLLNLMNKINHSYQEVKNYIWKREANRGFEIKNKVVGIIGFGNTGREVAKRLASFDCEIIAFDKNKKNFTDTKAKPCTLEDIFKHADIVTLHIPLNAENYHWVNEKFFNQFQKNIWFLNTSRGEIVVTKDLIEALKNKKILGAGLDVLENEKLATFSNTQKEEFEFLTQQNNVIITPHVAGWTFESYERINEVLVNKIKDIIYTKN
jgi:D-3-phosphoglycerate dehydrogenase